MRETFDTGLFTARGPERLGWAHQTYADFLAARYVCRQRFPLKQIVDLMWSPGADKKLVPQLQEMAAWLASMKKEVFEQMLLSEPDLLLRSDVATADEDTKRELVKAIVSHADGSFSSFDWWKIRPRYRKLNYPGLARQLSAFLKGRSLGNHGKVTAADIADACEVQKLFPTLLQLALDPSTEIKLRCTSADIIARKAGPSYKRRLRPLALGYRGAEDDEDLKGAGLRACWPKFLSAKELFQTIIKPRERVTSTYSLFLSYDLVEGLQTQDLPIALKWAESQGSITPMDYRHDLVSRIIERAAQDLNNRRIRPAFVRALLCRLRLHDYHSGANAEPLNKIFDPDARLRHDCTEIALKLFEDDSRDAFLITWWGVRLVASDDLSWLLRKLRHTSNVRMRERISEIVRRIFRPDDARRVEAIINAAKKCAESGRFFDIG